MIEKFPKRWYVYVTLAIFILGTAGFAADAFTWDAEITYGLITFLIGLELAERDQHSRERIADDKRFTKIETFLLGKFGSKKDKNYFETG
jgi:hypothetical protein